MTTTELLSNLDALVLCCFSIFLLTAYLTTVELLRFRRMRNENAYFSSIYPDNASLGCMTNEDAHRITKYLMQYEFPFAFEVSLAASLYRPYGIPSISRVVCKTKQFADVHVASKRTADTAVLVVDMAQNPPESEKCCGAISRMNYIHGIYQRAGMIKDEDMLYTLALLALLPATFIGQHEWRDLTTVELCAAGVFWKSLGDAMNLSYVGLPSAPPDDGVTSRSASGWRDGIHFLEELRVWSDQYELDHMVSDEMNHRAAVETEPVLTYGMPKLLGNFSKEVLSAVMDDRLRHALMLDEPSKLVSVVAMGSLALRKFVLRHLSLPRSRPHIRVTLQPDAKGRYHRTTWAAEPWYVKPTIANRYRWQAWKEWFAGRPLPGDHGVEPEGYVQEEVGPKRFKGKGLKEFKCEKDRLMGIGRGGCPFG